MLTTMGTTRQRCKRPRPCLYPSHHLYQCACAGISRLGRIINQRLMAPLNKHKRGRIVDVCGRLSCSRPWARPVKDASAHADAFTRPIICTNVPAPASLALGRIINQRLMAPLTSTNAVVSSTSAAGSHAHDHGHDPSKMQAPTPMPLPVPSSVPMCLRRHLSSWPYNQSTSDGSTYKQAQTRSYRRRLRQALMLTTMGTTRQRCKRPRPCLYPSHHLYQCACAGISRLGRIINQRLMAPLTSTNAAVSSTSAAGFSFMLTTMVGLHSPETQTSTSCNRLLIVWYLLSDSRV